MGVKQETVWLYPGCITSRWTCTAQLGLKGLDSTRAQTCGRMDTCLGYFTKQPNRENKCRKRLVLSHGSHVSFSLHQERYENCC